MRAPRKAHINPVSENLTRVTMSRRLGTEPMSGEVTNQMMLGDRMYQAATQVNVLSPEIPLIVEVDALHFDRRQNCWDVTARKQQLYRGLRQWHDTRWIECELGRSTGFSEKKTEYIETSRKDKN